MRHPADAPGDPETVAGVSTLRSTPMATTPRWPRPVRSSRPMATCWCTTITYRRSYASDLGGETENVIASPDDGFTWIGQSPGVSADGRIVVFTGDRGNGPGLFASYVSGGGSRTIIRLAGEGVDGFTDFDPLQAVRVNDTESTERGATVVFEGTSNLGTGIYTTRLSFFGAAANNFNPDAPYSVEVSGATPVALDGDVMQAASSSTPAVTISSVSLWNGINDENRGEVAFWAQLSDGSQSIITAEPQQVVWINFAPAEGSAAGRDVDEPGPLDSDGRLVVGMDGDFMDVLGSLGYHASYISLESDIVAAVQSYYSAVDADVVVLGGWDVQPPAYVPYVITDDRVTSRSLTRRQPETRGVYQTVYVGGGPDEGTPDLTDLGMASPTYTVRRRHRLLQPDPRRHGGRLRRPDPEPLEHRGAVRGPHGLGHRGGGRDGHRPRGGAQLRAVSPRPGR